MCGIAGFWAPEHNINDAEQVLANMGQAIAHRGPDMQDHVWDRKYRLGLVHRRLSIQDLSPAGSQPMTSSSRRFVIVYNGEIYNFRDIAVELQNLGYRFRGHSDTEVMLASFEEWGVEKSLVRFAGMFAFALWDCVESKLWLVRDRMGEKPLYYGWNQGVLIFGSELKALRAFPGFRPEINRDSLTLFVRHNYIPAPHTIYQGIHKLLPAHYICFNLAQGRYLPEPRAYWSLSDTFKVENTSEQTTVEDELDCRLGKVIKEQMVSDVPLGAFLSGGIDSTLVVALMQKHASRPVRTFSIGFDVPGFNEAEHAAAVARHLGTEHAELYVTSQDALSVIPKLHEIYDEPFADSSQVPTYLVSRMTREQVTVALSGDGGDELFAGYARYQETLNAWQSQHASPGLKQLIGHSILGLPPLLAMPLIYLLLPEQRKLSAGGLKEKLLRENTIRMAPDLQSFYARREGFWAIPERLVLNSKMPNYAMSIEPPDSILSLPPLKLLQWLDLNCYLPDDILTKVDRAAMAVSLETRIPFLDHRIVSFAMGLPECLLMDGDRGKAILRRILYRYVPAKLIERPKQGFAIPAAKWLRHELRDWAESLLNPAQILQDGYFDAKLVNQLWDDFLKERKNYSTQLWGILMFQSWLKGNFNI